MTAEVAVLNRGAVAIAADSAVTLGGPGRKIYNTANKLFPLSIVEPVAVMVYGAGSFGPIPWDTVVKEHRQKLASTSYGTIEEYAETFIGYLSSLVPHVPVDEQRDRVVMTGLWELGMVHGAVVEAVEAAEAAGTSLDEGAIRGILLTRVNDRIDSLQRGEYVDGLSASVAGREISAAIDDWSDFVHRSLDGLPVSSEIERRARVLVRTSLRLAQPSPWSGGVVVTGFGTDQLFPALSHYLVDGVIAGRVRARRLNGVCIGEEQSASIYPFAQEDMVATFMDGLHPGYRLALDGFVDETIGLLIEHFGRQVEGSLSESEHAKLLKEMSAARTAIARHFQDRLDDFLETHNSGPIMSIVELLPKEELAEMAEALVNLTSFKRRVTPEAETVGGPIDVAVISKGDGLVWIKRKHYFSPDLNYRYFDRDRRLRNAGTIGGAP